MSTKKSADPMRVRPGKAWPFPSDHLPIGLTVSFPSKIDVRIASWNVLNTAFISWIYKDEQGLNGSAITAGDVPAGPPNKGLTVREVAVVSFIERLLFSQPRHSVVCLQEVGPAVFRQLRSMRRASEVQMIPTTEDAHSKDRGIVIFDPSAVSLASAEVHVYQTHDGKYAQMAQFSVVDGGSGEMLTVIGTHVPWGNGKRELAEWLSTRFAPAIVGPLHAFACVGDMNNGSASMAAAMPAGFRSLPPPYRTHINAQSLAVDYDNSIITGYVPIVAQNHQEVLNDPAMETALSLLR